ncbi:MAG: alpha/beta hydrolase [Kiloniellales bacterium]
MRVKTFLGLSSLGFHRIVYREWGPERAERTLLCLHGLTRNGKDFVRVAEAMAAEGWRVVAPDTVGRGDSQWAVAATVYGYPQYLADMNALIARLEVERLDWLGTSMGGLVGMMLAAQPGSPITRLILNDIGPFIPKASLERIATYAGQDIAFTSREEAKTYARETYASFGSALTDTDWDLMTEITFARAEDGRYRLRYDPAIAEVFKTQPIKDVELWSVWDAIKQPTLALRGAVSDLLLPETAEEMRGRGPKAEIITFEGCGHAPSLLEPQQVAAVRDWLV